MRKLISIAVAALLVAPAVMAEGEVYRWKDGNGVWHYSDQQQPGAELVKSARRTSSTTPAANTPPSPAAAPVPQNATLPVSLVMARAIREYYERTGYKVGFKPAGGIKTAKQSLDWLILMKEELGDRWLRPYLFRFGASSLLTDIERQLEHFVTGRYSAGYRHPAG